MKFTLTIELGNDTMQSGQDVAVALGRISARLNRISGCMGSGDQDDVWDANGNSVGYWQVTEAALDAESALERLEACRSKHSDYGAMDTEGSYAVQDVADAAKAGKPFPFQPRKPDDPLSRLVEFNPFQLYQSVPGWEAASAELITAAEVYWKALVTKKLGVAI